MLSRANFPTEGKVLLAILILFLAAEGTARLSETRWSKDVAHLRSLPEAARRLEEDDGAFTVLVVGNSLARCGIDRDVLVSGLEDRLGRVVRVEAFHPDASSATEWAWGLERCFSGPGPDLLLVVTGRLHLFDQPVEPEKLGAYYVRSAQLAEAVANESGPERKSRLILGHLSALLANRERVRSLVGYRLLPGYSEAWPRLAVSSATDARNTEPAPGADRATSHALHRIASHARRSGSRIVVVAVPLPEAYELPASVQDELRALHVGLVDLASTPLLPPDHFPDGYHLDASGSRAFTETLTRFIPLTP